MVQRRQYLFDTASGLLTLRFCALSSHASQDLDIVASCDTNATGLAVLRVDELDFTCDNNGTGLTVHSVAQVRLSLSRSHRDGSDNAINLPSSTDFSSPCKGSSSLPCIWRSDTTSSIRNEQSKKSVQSVTSERTFGQNVSELVLGVVLTYFIWIIRSKMILSNNLPSAILWVRDTCLIVGLLPLMIILITDSLSSKILSMASKCDGFAFEVT